MFLFFGVILSIGGQAFAQSEMKCPDDGKIQLANFSKIQEKMHNNFHESTATIHYAFYVQEKNSRKNEQQLDLKMERSYGSGGVNYNGFQVVDPNHMAPNYTSVQGLPKDPQRIIDFAIQTDKDVNGSNWMKFEINSSNYYIPAPVCEIDPRTKKLVYKFQLNPNKGKKGLFNGKLITDENGVPIALVGRPNDTHPGLEDVQVIETFEQDPKTNDVYYHQITSHTKTGPFTITVGDTAVTFDNHLDGASVNVGSAQDYQQSAAR